MSEAERGVSVSLIEPALPSAPTVLHYEAGPVTYRQFTHCGHPWLALYEAEHDGVGWLVVKSTCRPLVPTPGDYALFRGRIEEDQGDVVLATFEGKGFRVTRPMPRKTMVHLEEARELTRAQDLTVGAEFSGIEGGGGTSGGI